MKKNNEVYAAIAMAMHEYMGNNIHDVESNVITIKTSKTQWNNPLQMMTKRP